MNRWLNKIICADCLDVMREMPDKCVDLVLTDPPYSTPVAVSFGREVCRSLSDLSIQASYVKMLSEQWRRICKPRARMLVFCDDIYYPVLFTVFYEWPFRQMVVWDKGRIGLGAGFRRQHELIIHACQETGTELNLWGKVTSHPSVLRFSPVSSQERMHGAQKPIDLLKYLIMATTSEGNTVLDPFLGSGSTAIACAETNRQFIGIELNPDYCKLAESRIARATAQMRLFHG